MKNFFSFCFEILKVVLIALIIVIPIRYFVFQPFYVKGESMEPNFHDGDYLIVDQLSYHFRDPQRGEVVVLTYDFSSQHYIKRIIGLPGERIEISQENVIIYQEDEKLILDESVYLPSSVISTPDGFSLELSQDEYFVMGDNRLFSVDSRRWGPAKRSGILGRALIRTWPPAAWAMFESPAY